MPAAPSPRQKTAKALTQEAAREKMLAKLTTAGAKGSAALFPARTTETDRALYAVALAEMEAAEEVFTDPLAAKPKFYLWSARPALPSPAGVAAELAAFAAQRFPLLATSADFKKHLGKDRAKVTALAEALTVLVEEKHCLVLEVASGKKRTTFYAPIKALRAALGDPSQAKPAASFRPAYSAVVERTGFPAVMLSELLRECGADLPALHRWAREEHQAGRAVLSFGDWSLASAAQQAAVLELHGDRYLQIRLLA